MDKRKRRKAVERIARYYFQAGWLRHCWCGGSEKDWEQHWADRTQKRLQQIVDELLGEEGEDKGDSKEG